jgi:hypothetical protein
MRSGRHLRQYRAPNCRLDKFVEDFELMLVRAEAADRDTRREIRAPQLVLEPSWQPGGEPFSAASSTRATRLPH